MKKQESSPVREKASELTANLLNSKKAALRRAGAKLLQEHAQSGCGYTSHFVNSPLGG
jgi:hypothetical protein